MNIAYTSIGRYGDTILASIIANMLTATGHKVTWVTSQPYLDLVTSIAPDVEIKLHPIFKDKIYSSENSTPLLR